MKKIIAILLVLVMMLGIVACAPADKNPGETSKPAASTPSTPSKPAAPESTVMTHAEYLATEKDAPVEIEAYVQATQSWYNGQITIYAQDKTGGGYFCYNIPCTEEQAALLVAGTKINVKGYKTAYKDMPEVDSKDAVLTILEGDDTYIAEAEDMTALLGKQELVNKASVLAAFKGLTIAKIEYRNGTPGDDIYVDVTLGEATYSFCVERYLTDPDTEVYKAFADLQVGDKVDMEGFVYWYDAEGVADGTGINTHITKVTKVAA